MNWLAQAAADVVKAAKKRINATHGDDRTLFGPSSLGVSARRIIRVEIERLHPNWKKGDPSYDTVEEYAYTMLHEDDGR